MNRTVYLIYDGIHVASCLILYDAELRLSCKNFYPIENIAKKLFDFQIDYDIVK